MRVEEIVQILEATPLGGGWFGDREVAMACGSDLMSDVLSFTKRQSMLLTGLTTPQVIYTAEMAEVDVVCFVRSKTPPRETISLAMQKDIALLATRLPMFESCGRLYARGLKGCSEVSSEGATHGHPNR